jgi:hypothetical protein
VKYATSQKGSPRITIGAAKNIAKREDIIARTVRAIIIFIP